MSTPIHGSLKSWGKYTVRCERVVKLVVLIDDVVGLIELIVTETGLAVGCHELFPGGFRINF